MNYLVPLDFSDQSRTAAEYTAALTKVWPGNVQLVHVIVPVDEESTYVPVKTLQMKRNTVFEFFNFQEELRRKHEVRTGSEIVKGSFVTSVIKTAQKEKSDLVVMGMQGNSGLREYLYGSNTMAMLEASSYPVLTVPAECSFKPYRHIVYHTNYDSRDLGHISSLGKIAAKFKAVFSLISINSAVDPQRIEEFRARVRQLIPYTAINFEERQSENGVAEALEGFCVTESVDLIGISLLDERLVHKIAGRDLEGDYTFHVDIPVLFLPA